MTRSALGVPGPGADHAFLAAELIAFARCRVERARNPRFDRIAVGAAGIAHIDRQRSASALHGHRGAFALALLARRGPRVCFAGTIVRLAVGRAFADRERTPT